MIRHALVDDGKLVFFVAHTRSPVHRVVSLASTAAVFEMDRLLKPGS
jgi:hypothetical protein